MNDLGTKLQRIRGKDGIRVMIVGLGSVGSYLLDYLMSSGMDIEIVVAGRNREKIEERRVGKEC